MNKAAALLSAKDATEFEANVARREQILQLVRETVLEGLYRRAAVAARPHDFEAFIEALILKLLDDSPDVWLHQHLIGGFAQTINENESLRHFLVYVTNQLKSQFAILGITTETQVTSCHYSIRSGLEPNGPYASDSVLDNELIMLVGTRENWPKADSVKSFLMKNSLALSMAMIQQHCLVREIIAWVSKINDENKKRWTEAQPQQGAA